MIRGKTICIRRASPRPKDPKSPAQVMQRMQWKQAKQFWAMEVSHEARAAWQAYAERHAKELGMFPGDPNGGYSLFVKAQCMRMKRGLDLSQDAPAQSPPPPVTSLAQLPAEAVTTFRLIANHAIQEVDGMNLLVEITPATPKLTRKPRKTDLRYICGPFPPSFLPLMPSGSEYVVPAAQFAISPGDRYGMRVRIVTADDIASSETTGDFIRLPLSERQSNG
jgi:hypothetical protein